MSKVKAISITCDKCDKTLLVKESARWPVGWLHLVVTDRHDYKTVALDLCPQHSRSILKLLVK